MSTNLRRRSDEDHGFTLVELMVVLVIGSLLGAVVVSVLMSQYRTEQYTSEMQQVMDDGRLSLDRIRQELRGGRRVYPSSTAHHLYWWTDQNQDGIQQPEERINYCVTALNSTTCVNSVQTGKFRLLRWSDAESPSAGRTIAATLTDTDVFSGYSADMVSTRVVNMVLDLDVQEGIRGPEQITMETAVRLRNVA